MLRKFILLSFVCSSIGFTQSACTSSTPESKPMPVMTFEHVQPLAVKVASINVDNQYHASANPADASSSFPTPPDVALRRYAENKLKPAGGSGVLNFVIEDVDVSHHVVEAKGTVNGLFGMNDKDHYEVVLKIRLFEAEADGSESAHSILNMRRSISIPQHYSLSEKEHEKYTFLEMLMNDVDKAVTKTLKENMRIGGYGVGVSTASLLASPEIGGEQNQYGEQFQSTQ